MQLLPPVAAAILLLSLEQAEFSLNKNLALTRRDFFCLVGPKPGSFLNRLPVPDGEDKAG